MNARVKYGAKLALIAVVGFLVVLPWAIAWVYLFNHAVLPYVRGHFNCCSAPRVDPGHAIFSLYATFDAALAAVVALISSLALGTLVRPKWLIPWLLLCASTALGIRAAALTKVFGPANVIFMVPDAAAYAYAVAAGVGFWIARVWRIARIPSNYRLERP